MNRYRNRGFTLIELLTVMAIISLLIGLLLPALATARAKAQMSKDQSQVKQIHQAWVAFARDYEGAFPTPGLIYREEDPVLGLVPGRGPERLDVNDTQSMYSACIMAQLFAPQLCVSPTEPSGFVLVKDDYRWDVYDALNGIYWDHPNPNEGFEAELDSLCNTSYAHTPICGDRKIRQWKDTADSKFAVIATRGVENGSLQGNIYDESVTLEFHGARKEWQGLVGFNDGHVQVERTFYPEGLSWFNPLADGTESQPDNIFRNDSGNTSGNVADGFDIWLTIVSEISDDCTITAEWD